MASLDDIIRSKEAANRPKDLAALPALRTLLEDVIPTSSVFNDFELEHTFPIIGRRVMLLNGRKLRAGSHAELPRAAAEERPLHRRRRSPQADQRCGKN